MDGSIHEPAGVLKQPTSGEEADNSVIRCQIQLIDSDPAVIIDSTDQICWQQYFLSVRDACHGLALATICFEGHCIHVSGTTYHTKIFFDEINQNHR